MTTNRLPSSVRSSVADWERYSQIEVDRRRDALRSLGFSDVQRTNIDECLAGMGQPPYAVDYLEWMAAKVKP